MKMLALSAAIASSLLLALGAHAQTPPTDKAAARAMAVSLRCMVLPPMKIARRASCAGRCMVLGRS